MNDEISRHNTELMQLDNLKDHYPADLTNDEIGNLIYFRSRFACCGSKEISESKAHIESKVLDLEKEKRKEQIECWRDLMFLKKYLMSSLKDYWELVKKREVLEGDFGEDVAN